MLNPELPETPLPGRTQPAGDRPDSAVTSAAEQTSARGSAVPAGQGPDADRCVRRPHVHVGQCQRAGYAYGYRDGYAAGRLGEQEATR